MQCITIMKKYGVQISLTEDSHDTDNVIASRSDEPLKNELLTTLEA